MHACLYVGSGHGVRKRTVSMEKEGRKNKGAAGPHGEGRRPAGRGTGGMGVREENQWPV